MLNEDLNSNLNKNYTFANYIKGDFNKEIISFSELFVNDDKIKILSFYGDVGTGKTHLLHAIGNKFSELFPNKRVIFVSSEDIIREFYSFIDNQLEILEIQNNLLNYDLILFDDFQYLCKKEKAEEIFFNFIENLFSNSKSKIVLTYDEPLPSLEQKIKKRVFSRITSGINCEIKTPDIKTLKLIAKQKFVDANDTVQLTNEATEFLANRALGDIRRLGGMITKIIYKLLDNPAGENIVTLEYLSSIFNNAEPVPKNYRFDVNPNVVVENVCTYYNTLPKEVISKNRKKNISYVRDICVYVLKKKLQISYEEIGEILGSRNHSTISNSFKKVERMIKLDEDLKKKLTDFINKI
ncbi:MAG: ATP-binding protein [Mycoplasmataceae bacterium]|nr:ATP-binding protein [Mycoplasmataceae bacterium]